MRKLIRVSRSCWLAGLILSGLASLVGCGDLVTGDSESGRKNYAVIVGISSYQSQSLNLKWADEDALDVYDTLRRGKNWETDKITLLTNAAATRDGIKSAIAGLAKRVGADDQVVFYFSGRGSYSPDQPPFDEGDGLDEFLVPYDALPNSPAQDLSDDELEALFSSLPTNNVLIVLDAGFAPRPGSPTGREKNLVRAPAGAGAARTAASRLDGMGRELARPGYVLVTASLPGEAPTESNQLRNGVFTYFFTEGLRGAASGGRKNVSAQQAFEYAVLRATSTAGQAPQMLDNRGKTYRVLSF
jgi:uncharacterized caspase-like protein